jgi:hypothetical protein
MKFNRILFAAAGLSLALAPLGASAARHLRAHAPHHVAMGSWDGHWTGAWGGNDPTAINISGGHVVSYVYGGQTTPVSSSKVTATKIVYGESGVVVTLTRTGAKTAHATIHSSQGDGVAELVRQ